MGDDQSGGHQRRVITSYSDGGGPYYVDFCFDFTGLFLGAAGAVGVGFYTGFFKKIPPSLLKSIPPNLTNQMKKAADSFTKVEGKVKKAAGSFPQVEGQVKKAADSFKNVEGQVKKAAESFTKVEEQVKKFDGLMTGGPLAWRIAKRAALGSCLYCFLECRLQGHKMYRSSIDCALAGALSGLAFGARGGWPAAGYSAAGFSAFALVSYFLYH